MVSRLIPFGTIIVSLLIVAGCTERDRSTVGSDTSLPPVYSLGPANMTNWDTDAGPFMLVSLGDRQDSAAVVLPEATDSVLDLQGQIPAIRGLVFELFGRTGAIGSSAAIPFVSATNAKRECSDWPGARLISPHSGWRVGFVRGTAHQIKLDSIESLSSPDSAALAVALTQSVSTLPISSDPTFRRLPFRVRSAYTFALDSVQVVIADVIRALNEEANPRIEDLFFVGERPASSKTNYTVGYFNRVAGAEETIQATEILGVVAIGASRRPAIVVSIESDDGSQLGLIERSAPGEWRATWKSAYTDC
jgi:hypothetical protein